MGPNNSIKVQNSDLFRIEKIFQIFAIVQEGKLKEPYISHPINWNMGRKTQQY